MTKTFYSFFKQLKRQKYVYFVALSVLASVFFYACKHDGLGGTGDSVIPSETFMTISFEMETIRTQKSETPEANLTAFEKIATMPQANRSIVSFNLFDDGTSETTIQKVEPKLFIVPKPKDETPPNLVPETVLTKITRDGVMHFYDKNNNEKSNYKMAKMHDYKPLIAQLKSDSSLKNTIIDGFTGTKTGKNVQNLINLARQNGDIVTEVASGIVTIKHTEAGNSAKGTSFRSADNLTSENFVDLNNSILAGSKLFDDQNRVVFEKWYKYVPDENNKPKLDATHEEETDFKNPTGHIVKSICDASYSNLTTKIIIH